MRFIVTPICSSNISALHILQDHRYTKTIHFDVGDVAVVVSEKALVIYGKNLYIAVILHVISSKFI